MKKTLQEIIERNDYVRVNTALVKRAKELAEIIGNKMRQLDLVGEDNGVYVGRLLDANYYFVGTVHSRGCGLHDDFLFARRDVRDGVYANLDGLDGYYAGDFSCPMRSASSNTYRDFLNDASKILDWLDDYETRLVAASETALKNADSITA